MDNTITEFTDSVVSAMQSLTSIAQISPEEYSREASDKILSDLREAQESLQMAFTRIRKVRKNLFMLQSGETVPNNS